MKYPQNIEDISFAVICSSVAALSVAVSAWAIHYIYLHF